MRPTQPLKGPDGSNAHNDDKGALCPKTSIRSGLPVHDTKKYPETLVP